MRLEYGAIEGLQTYVDSFPEAARDAARFALNDVVEGSGLAQVQAAIAKDINFPPGYLNADRLGIGQRATVGNLSVSIVGRFRPTSLARFVTQTNAPGKYGVKVQVKRGGRVADIRDGFVIRLRNQNLGLAVRLKPGERLRESYGAKELGAGSGVYLLYGPSIDQVSRGVFPKEAPEILKQVETEFFRQFFRLTKKGR